MAIVVLAKDSDSLVVRGPPLVLEQIVSPTDFIPFVNLLCLTQGFEVAAAAVVRDGAWRMVVRPRVVGVGLDPQPPPNPHMPPPACCGADEGRWVPPSGPET